MNDDEVFEMYRSGLIELDFNKCMKAVGILYFQNNEEAVYTDIEVNFLQGKYEYVIYLAEKVREKNESNIGIDEYYYASLALCKRFPRLRRELRRTNKNPISDYCERFIESIVLRNNEKIYDRIGLRHYENTAFRRMNLDRNITELINIYEMQQALVEAYQGDDERIRDNYGLIDEKVKLINISSEFVKEIKKSVGQREVLNPHNIYGLFQEYYKSEGINSKGEIIAISQIRDILRLLDLLRRLKLIELLLEMFDSVEDIVFDAVKRQNKTAATYLKEIYFELTHYELFYDDVIDIEKKDSICAKCGKILNQYFPELLLDIGDEKNSSYVFSLLSDTAKPMFRAAEWQYKMVLEDANYGFRDAGMLCLSYIRLLELEMNTRALPMIWDHYENIWNEYIKIKPDEASSKKKKKTFKYKWGMIESLKPTTKGKGLTAGEWGMFFNTLSGTGIHESENALYSSIIEVLKMYVFNEKGMEALKDGKIAEVFDQETIVEKYRNPPAHTRYVTLDVALECKQYVERKLIFLEELLCDLSILDDKNTDNGA